MGINPKDLVGGKKPPLHAIPPVALVHLGLAMEDGKRKYGLMNWRDNAVVANIYYDAAMRHLMSWWDGEDVASDSKIKHLAHVMACCAILLDAEYSKNLDDDRPKPGNVANLLDELHQLRKLRAALEAGEVSGGAGGAASPFINVPNPTDSLYVKQNEVFGTVTLSNDSKITPND